MIDVNNISFKYAGGKDLVFDDFSLRLEETISMVCWVRTVQVRVHCCISSAAC